MFVYTFPIFDTLYGVLRSRDAPIHWPNIHIVPYSDCWLAPAYRCKVIVTLELSIIANINVFEYHLSASGFLYWLSIRMSLTDRQMDENDFRKGDRWRDCIDILCCLQQQWPRDINILHSNHASGTYAYQIQVINIIYKHLYAEYFTEKGVCQENAR